MGPENDGLVQMIFLFELVIFELNMLTLPGAKKSMFVSQLPV